MTLTKRDHIPILVISLRLAVNQTEVSMTVPKLITIQLLDIIIQQLDTKTQVLVTIIPNRVWDIPMITKILKLVAAVDELVTCHTINQNSNLFLNLSF